MAGHRRISEQAFATLITDHVEEVVETGIRAVSGRFSSLIYQDEQYRLQFGTGCHVMRDLVLRGVTLLPPLTYAEGGGNPPRPGPGSGGPPPTGDAPGSDSAALVLQDHQNEGRHEPGTSSTGTTSVPGILVTEPAQMIVFNGPYDDKHTYHIKITNSSARRIG